MAPTPPNITRRLKCHYVGPEAEHVMLFHGITGVSTADLVAGVRQVVAQMADLQFNGTSWDNAQVADPGSDVFNFVSGWTPIVSASGSSPGVGNGVGNFVQFGMRALDGKRAKWYVFEVVQQIVPDYRIPSNTVTAFQDVVDKLNDAANKVAVITGLHGVAYQYVNVGVNDYWTHKARRGS